MLTSSRAAAGERGAAHRYPDQSRRAEIPRIRAPERRRVRVTGESGLAAIAEQLRVEDPRAWTDERRATRKITVLPELEARFAGNPAAGQEIATGMLGAVVMILLVACVNLATMMMARGAREPSELNVRLAIGAPRGRILRQLLTEKSAARATSVLLSVIVVAFALRLFETYRPSDIPSFSVAIDASVGGFTVLIALTAALLFGPAAGRVCASARDRRRHQRPTRDPAPLAARRREGTADRDAGHGVVCVVDRRVVVHALVDWGGA